MTQAPDARDTFKSFIRKTFITRTGALLTRTMQSDTHPLVYKQHGQQRNGTSKTARRTELNNIESIWLKSLLITSTSIVLSLKRLYLVEQVKERYLTCKKKTGMFCQCSPGYYW